MPSFNYLGKQGFPHAGNVDVYRYDNDFDYGRYDYSQMRLTVCNVPWDLGEAHIGNRHIDGVGNVVHFGTKAKRDAWFHSLPDSECFRWETKFKELHRDGRVTVPLPFDVAARYNYVFVEYNLFANDDSPVEYESSEGVSRWCYFVRNVTFESPNTTVMEVLDDVWQTFIYDIDVTGMVLERGHAPLFASDVDTYLANPLDNSRYLLTEDVNFGDLQRVTKTQALALNAEGVKACIATTANITASWDNKTPGLGVSDISGAPSVQVFCCDAANLDSVLLSLESSRPQFKQTVQGIFFIESRYLTLGSSFTIGNITCNIVSGGSGQVNRSLLSRSKADWGYDTAYANLAKLYTFPYSAIEVTDEDGNATLVRIEDTTGPLTVDVCANLVFPYINLSAVVKGIGGTASASVKFQNVTSRTFNVSGRWYGLAKSWEVPTFAVVLDAAKEYDYSTRFSRAQAKADAETARTIAKRDVSNNKTNADLNVSNNKTNADLNVSNTKTNADASASTNSSNAQNAAHTQAANEVNNANNVVDNASAQVTCNNAVTIAGNDSASNDTSLVNALSVALQAWNAGYVNATTNEEIEAANQQTAVAAGSAVLGGIASGAVSGFASAGGIGAAAGAIGGAVSGAISGVTSTMQNNIATNLSSAKAAITNANSESTMGETNNSNLDRTTNQNRANGKINDANNTLTTTSAANTSSTMIENAYATRNRAIDNAQALESTEKANNTRDYNTGAAVNTNTYNTGATVNKNTYNTGIADADDAYNNALARIQNNINQAALSAPSVFGSVSAAANATTKPQALFANIVTQSKAAIKQAGDEFLRYGYRLDQFWEFDGNWCVGKHFTYWKLKDYWVKSNDMQDYYQDAIRFFLMGGVTVWANPDDIGAVSIYDNGK